MKKKYLAWAVFLTVVLSMLIMLPTKNVHADATLTPDTNFTPPTFNPDDPNSSGNIIDDGKVANPTNGDLKTNLENWQEDLEVNDPITSISRGIGWWMVIQLGDVVNGITGASTKTLGVLDIYGSDTNVGPLQKTVNDYLPIFVAIGTVVFVAMTVGILFSKNQDVVVLLKSLLLSVSILFLLPYGFGQLSSLTKDIDKFVTTQGNTGYAVIDKNIVDLYAVDKNYNWVVPKSETVDDKAKNQNFLDKINKNNLQHINVNASVDPTKMGEVGKKISSNMLTTNEKGKEVVVTLNDGVGKSWWQSLLTGDASYYRYHVSFFKILYYEILVLVVSGFLLYKLIKILIEIVTNAGILEATALTDTKGKRNWELITKIVSGFSATVMVVFLQVLFSDGYAVTSTLPGGVFVQAVAGLALAFAVIEGPNAFQSLFGVHAGLNDGLKDLMTLSQGSMLAKNVSSGVMKAAGAVKNGFGGAAGGMAGMMAGAIGNDNPTDNLGKTSEDLASDTVAGGNESNQEMNQNNQNQNSNQNNESLNEQDQSNNGENVDLNESSLGESNADNQDFSAGTEAMNATDPELASLYGQMDDGGGAFEGEPAPEQMGDQGSNFDQTPPEESTQMGSDHSQATDNDLGHDNLNKASQSQNMAQNEAEQFAGESIARPMTLSDAGKNIISNKINQKINSPKPNMIQRYHSAYQTSKMLSRGTKNSLNNTIGSLKNKGEDNA
ncbi:hypothetical protein IL308_09585 [Lactococcus lactis]|uniref:DUF8208 domain-containing protein n=1 Tax=Lactococcus lactis TaxID=1358 RepID=A0A9X4NJ77_9LACT|nr:hypothetical protein [Lactococcus lactis]MBK5077011.1 hypothetical protein [Lactococcus lactis]MDG4984767.1 hypothetical protein [Lactococcus lactis]